MINGYRVKIELGDEYDPIECVFLKKPSREDILKYLEDKRKSFLNEECGCAVNLPEIHAISEALKPDNKVRVEYIEVDIIND